MPVKEWARTLENPECFLYTLTSFTFHHIYFLIYRFCLKKGSAKILRYIPCEECFVGVGGGLAPVQLVHGASVDELRLHLQSLGHTVHQVTL